MKVSMQMAQTPGLLLLSGSADEVSARLFVLFRSDEDVFSSITLAALDAPPLLSDESGETVTLVQLQSDHRRLSVTVVGWDC